MHPGPFPPKRQQTSAPQTSAPLPPRTNTGRFLFIGCLGLVMLTVFGTVAAVYVLGSKLAGTTLGQVAVTPGVPTTLSFTDPGKDSSAVWLELDATHTQGVRLMGTFAVTAGGRLLGQYSLDGDLSGRCANPVLGQNSSACVNWVYAQSGAGGSVAGRTRLFSIPQQPTGTAVTVAGTLYVAPGVTTRALTLTARD